MGLRFTYEALQEDRSLASTEMSDSFQDRCGTPCTLASVHILCIVLGELCLLYNNLPVLLANFLLLYVLVILGFGFCCDIVYYTGVNERSHDHLELFLLAMLSQGEFL